MVRKLVRVAVAVERGLDGAQDIEGALVGDQVYLLQSRPQV